MKVTVLGAGPGGLYFSILIKRSNPSHQVTVFERNAADTTFGFGVVFSERALDHFEQSDPDTYCRLAERLVSWDSMELRVRDETLRCRGIGFSAIARRELLNLLQERATELDVRLEFEYEISDPADLDNCDLLVAADGVNSLVRRAYADDFQPETTVGPAHYIWFGTPARFEGLTFPFVRGPKGSTFYAHAYPYDAEMSTFIVETDDESWRSAGFDGFADRAQKPGETDLASLETCSELFHEHLNGAPLIGNNSKWLRFSTVRNTHWRKGKVVLLGDAAHTAHFSIGSGTRLAMDDAIALAQALTETADVDSALGAYAQVRKPQVERLQLAAAPSEDWWSRVAKRLETRPSQFAFNYFTRTGQFTYDDLRKRDSRFVDLVERDFSHAEHPTAAGLRLRGVEFPNRLVVESAAEPQSVQVCADSGVGLVMITSRESDSKGRLRDLVAIAHNAGARIGIEIGAVGDVSLAVAAGFDVVEVSDPEGLSAVRKAWPKDRVLILRCEVPPTEAVTLARLLKASGCDVLRFDGPDAGVAADRVRLEEGLPTAQKAEDLNQARTLLLAGRADLVVQA